MGVDEERFAGLGLEQVIGVRVAELEGHPLDDVLAREAIELATFRRAEALARARVADDAAAQRVWARLEAEAEDALARATPPLDRDAAAWGAFSAWLSAQREPPPRPTRPGQHAAPPAQAARAMGAATLARFGLTSNDLSRLRRLWHRRALTDEEVRQRIHAGASRPSPCDVRPEPPRLAPFPWSPPAGRQPGAARESAAPWEALAHEAQDALPVERDVDVWAALTAALERVDQGASPDDAAGLTRLPYARELALDLVCLDEAGLARAQATWRERLRRDAVLRAELSVRLVDHRAALTALLR
jgi:hypothetical protein